MNTNSVIADILFQENKTEDNNHEESWEVECAALESEETNIMIKTKILLEGIPNYLQTPEYREVYNKVVEFCKSNCNHEWIYDYIDINTEKSNQIC